MKITSQIAVVCIASGLLLPGGVMAQASQTDQPCPRYTAGSTIVEPEDLFSSDGVLRLSLTYQTRIDADGNTLYCFMNSDGAQSPTLHVNPGDRLMIDFKNGLPASAPPTRCALCRE